LEAYLGSLVGFSFHWRSLKEGPKLWRGTQKGFPNYFGGNLRTEVNCQGNIGIHGKGGGFKEIEILLVLHPGPVIGKYRLSDEDARRPKVVSFRGRVKEWGNLLGVGILKALLLR